ncbi:MAG: DAK2 domain-containing protein [Erysipelotrichaceae bacterium]|nr:DAK2 domain-containing protein [Erysipelotrichaceae bacterium]
MEKIDGKILIGMLESGSSNLNNHKKDVDALNVFPVPDGDTGTNMSLTFTNGINEVRKNGSESLPVVAKTLSRGLLMGARGNSGVILSQIFRGFNQSVQGKEELTVADLSEAMLNGARLAYKAVMRPVEGTILTVIRESSDNAAAFVEANHECSIEEYMSCLTAEAEKSLAGTPELLPVLKEAHVVDSGGSGLLKIFEGFKAALDGKPFVESAKIETVREVKSEKASGYRTEYILEMNDAGMKSFNEDRIRKNLDRLGNKITLLIEDRIIKLRINTMMPGEILTMGQRYGEFKKVQVENIQDDLKPSIIIEEKPKKAEEKEYGIIATAAGAGIEKLFREYRTDVVVSGGQTMNPSTKDFCNAIAEVNARHIYILPNNSNIIMAAKQAADVTSGKDIIVLETRSIPQGLSACISFNPDASVDENTAQMKDAIANVRTGQVTYAIKDTTVDGREIHEGDYMGLFEKDIIVTSRDKLEASRALIDEMMDEDSEIVTLIRGKDATEEECTELEEYIRNNYEADVDVQDGGQPVYSFIIGVE